MNTHVAAKRNTLMHAAITALLGLFLIAFVAFSALFSSQVATGASAPNEGMGRANDGVTKLVDGSGSAAEGAAALAAGTGELSAGATKLADGQARPTSAQVDSRTAQTRCTRTPPSSPTARKALQPDRTSSETAL